jgi:predicted TIM-barrel fold metal-dependent hydrolase
VIGNGAPRPEIYRDGNFRAGLTRLTRLGLSLDAWLFHTQLADVVDLARAFPGTNIIVGHVGGVLGYGPYAGRRDEIFASWKASVTELAKCPNVVMKLGGMMMRAAFYDYGVAERPATSEELASMWRPYMETCIELFGVRRCMFESNFPVEKMGVGWVALWNAFKRITAGASVGDKMALFHDTAQRIYRLG